MSSAALQADDAMVLGDCWNRIGIRGDQSCPKLITRIHCRNCEVYADAAQRNLQRPVNALYREEWAAHFREPAAAPVVNDAAALVFRIGREWLALPASMVACVAPQAKAHRLPHRAGGGLLGIVNVGGKLHPALSLAIMLGIDETDAPAATGRHTFARLVLMQWEEQTIALPVADLHGIVRYASAALASPAATINKGMLRYLAGVLPESSMHTGMHIGVLDAQRVGHQMARLLR
ncbi:MAG: chemotaxis protein CheW [Bdellovibrionales bacterium]|nr:chemotaxis protein CheW [Massilia sp.]